MSVDFELFEGVRVSDPSGAVFTVDASGSLVPVPLGEPGAILSIEGTVEELLPTPPPPGYGACGECGSVLHIDGDDEEGTHYYLSVDSHMLLSNLITARDSLRHGGVLNAQGIIAAMIAQLSPDEAKTDRER